MPMEKLLKKGVDFRPSLHLHGDTGACNYYRYFKGLDWSQYQIVRMFIVFWMTRMMIFSETAILLWITVGSIAGMPQITWVRVSITRCAESIKCWMKS